MKLKKLPIIELNDELLDLEWLSNFDSEKSYFVSSKKCLSQSNLF